mmetsp:Transcript_32286/g.75252  ORF Transcript_32286/g.75252 Transcript_32286/m.75252 type:complete len:330 (-) Transcript_32286:247-1236(-)
MLDLVIEPAMKEVVQVGKVPMHGLTHPVARAEVGGRRDGAHVEGSRARRHGAFKLVHVLAAVVGRDDDEAVHVGEQISEREVEHRRPVERAGEQEERRRQCEEAQQEVGAHDCAHKIERARTELAPLLTVEQRHWQCERRVCLFLGEADALLAQLRDLELLVRVGRVIVPFPHGCKASDAHILEPTRQLNASHQLEVTLYEVRVATLAQPKVVQVVVLDVPGLRKHPIQPVARAPPHGAYCEAIRRESAAAAKLWAILPVVPAVADVVPDHCPACACPRAQPNDRNEAAERRRHPHREHAKHAARVRPRDHLLEVADVGVALPIGELLP